MPGFSNQAQSAELLAKPELFKDITGLEGTQKNAMKAFDTAVSAASAMGSQAAALARQAELSKTADKMVDRVGKALKNEMITPEQAEEITGSIIDGLNGKAEEVLVKLPVLGTYSATAPYDCPKSQRILEQGCQELAQRVAAPSYRQNPITRSLNALALLASGNREYLPLVRKEAQWAADYSADSFQ